jgi:hypothetical protein
MNFYIFERFFGEVEVMKKFPQHSRVKGEIKVTSFVTFSDSFLSFIGIIMD